MYLYIFLCLMSFLVGRGILRLIGLKIPDNRTLFLAPIITLAFWAILLSWGVILGIAIKNIAIGLWLLSFLLALIGTPWSGYRLDKIDYALLLAAVLVPSLLMAPYFLHGIRSYLGSWFWDGWSYIAYGQFLWEHSRDSQEVMSPLYQYAITINTRFVSSAIMSFLSPLTGVSGDTQAASGLFLTWSFFIYSSSSIFFVAEHAKSLSKIFHLLYVFVTVFSSWLLNLLIANNYDNLLAISFLPVFAGIISSINPDEKRWAVIIGMLAAGALNVYPEFFPPSIICILLYIGQRCLTKKTDLKGWITLILLSAIIGLFFVGPALKFNLTFFTDQLKTGMTSVPRPGEGYFPGLLNAYCFLGSFWGFWAPFEPCSQGKIISWGNALSLPISSLFLLGFLDLIRRRKYGIVFNIIFLFSGALAMILIWSYDYGAYKFLLLNWWATSFVVLWGAFCLRERFGNRLHLVLNRVGLPILLVLVTMAVAIRIMNFHTSVKPKDIAEYRQVEGINNIVHSELVMVSLNDPKALQWAIYYLRKTPLYLVYGQHPYFSTGQIMDAIKGVKVTDARYLLTDHQKSLPPGNPLWSGGPFYLWKLDHSWLFLFVSKNLNGIENWGGHQGFWMGNGDTELNLFAKDSGEVVLQGEFSRGPSLPEKAFRQLLISSDRGFQEMRIISTEGEQSFTIPVVAGKNRIILACPDKPTLHRQPNGDTRPLLIGVRGLQAKWVNGISKD